MKPFLRKLFVNLGVCDVLRAFNRAPRILFYHSIDDCTDNMVGMFTTSVSDFTKEIDYFQKKFEIISLEEFENRFRNKCFTNNELVLTFDDGFANALRNVYPVLSQRNIPYTVFISTDHIDSGEFFPTTINRMIFYHGGRDTISVPTLEKEFSFKNEGERMNALMEVAVALKTSGPQRVKSIVKDLINNVSQEEWHSLQQKFSSEIPMTWEEVKSLSDSGVTIGAHCKEHISVVDSVPEDVICDEIVGSKQIIETRLQKECRYFAYPSGHMSQCAIDCVASNFAMGFTTKSEEKITYETNTSCIPRIMTGRTLEDVKVFTSEYPQLKR